MAKYGMLKRPKPEDESTTAVYEVRCYTCDVSFPADTKRCMYCGKRPGRQPLFVPSLHPDPIEDFDPFGDVQPREFETMPSSAPIDSEESEAETPKGTLFRILGNLSWIVLFAAITLYRACTG